jgi:hypothetical protein
MATGQDTAEQLLNKLFCEGQGNQEAITTPSTASANVIVTDPAQFSISVLTLSGATPRLTLPAPAIGKKKRLVLVQDATGSRIPTWASASGAIKWVGARAPTLQTAAASIDMVDFVSYDGVNWVGIAQLNIA